MSVFGIIYQLFSIVFLGDYNPAFISDGAYIHEDWIGYDSAYELAYRIGTINR